MKAFALTTFDNPYDPFDDFKNWFNYDCEKGYNCCGYLARIAKTYPEMSDEERNEEIERAIDEIMELNPTTIYRKVSRAV